MGRRYIFGGPDTALPSPTAVREGAHGTLAGGDVKIPVCGFCRSVFLGHKTLFPSLSSFFEKSARMHSRQRKKTGHQWVFMAAHSSQDPVAG